MYAIDMHQALDQLVGKEVVVYTVATDDVTSDKPGHYVGTLRRVSEGALELRRDDGGLVYIAFPHIVRFFERP